MGVSFLVQAREPLEEAVFRLIVEAERDRREAEGADKQGYREALLSAATVVIDGAEAQDAGGVIVRALKESARSATALARGEPGDVGREGLRRGWWRAVYLVEAEVGDGGNELWT